MSPEQKKLYQESVFAFDIDIDSPCGFSGANSNTGSGSSDSPNAQRIWDFFKGKGLEDVAVAGIMGNFQQESGLDPAIKQNHTLDGIPDGGDDRTGFGIAQWTSQGRQAGLFAKMRQAGLAKYYGPGYGHPEVNKTEMSPQDISKLLDIELNYAWEGDTTKIKDIADELNKAMYVGGDNGSAILFHNLYEGSRDNAAQIAERVDSATDYLNIFGTGEGSCKRGQLGGVSSIEDALPWAMKFIEDTKEKYNSAPRSLAKLSGNKKLSDNVILVAEWPESSGLPASECWGGDGCDECTTLSGWFVTAMTDYTYGNGHGGQVVGRLKAKGVETGTEPRPFSVFSTNAIGGSTFGHTGVVLGVLSDNQVIALENNNGANMLKIFQYNIKEKYPDATFAYVGDKLKATGIDAQQSSNTNQAPDSE